MNRYQIKNNVSGLVTHGYEAEEPIAHQPEWGLLERSKRADQCTQQELESSIGDYFEEVGEESIAMVTLLQTYSVEVTDISEEVEARQEKASEKAEALQALIDCDPDDATTIASLRVIVKNILKVML